MSELAVLNQLEAKEETKTYIIFNVGRGTYGIDVASVNTIIQMPKITRVPNAPINYKGVINLRGDIVPVMSLPGRLDAREDVMSDETRIIILDLEDLGLVGVTVDEVKEVLNISDKELYDSTPFEKEDSTLVKGVAKRGDDLISILDIKALINK
jgi:purine-binding chemotaxis protein CheW